MDRSTTPPHDATRLIETAQGILSYTRLAPLLARRILEIEERIFADAYPATASAEALVLRFHQEMAGDIVPDWAGKWRAIPVSVGPHTPPPPHEVAPHMRRYSDDLETRLRFCGESEPLLLETLAFAEGRFLTIHPFRDFNGRVARLLLRVLLHRLDLPPVKLVPEPGGADEQTYLKALRGADRMDWNPLMAVWRERFERFRPDA